MDNSSAQIREDEFDYNEYIKDAYMKMQYSHVSHTEENREIRN